MAVGLAVGMDSLGFWSGPDAWATAWTARLGDGIHDVPAMWVLLLTVVSAYALPLLMLSSAQWGRRVVWWCSLLMVTVAWLPVLALASWKLPPCMPLVALLWSGLCALIYAQRHRLPCEMPVVSSKSSARKVKEVAVLSAPEKSASES